MLFDVCFGENDDKYVNKLFYLNLKNMWICENICEFIFIEVYLLLCIFCGIL